MQIKGTAGLVVATSTLSIRGEAHYRCDRGYSLRGNQTRTCLPRGQWSGAPPVCIRKYPKIIKKSVSFTLSFFAKPFRHVYQSITTAFILGLPCKNYHSVLRSDGWRLRIKNPGSGLQLMSYACQFCHNYAIYALILYATRNSLLITHDLLA